MTRKYAIEGDQQLVIVDQDGEPVKPIRFYPSWKEAQEAIKRLEADEYEAALAHRARRREESW